MSFKTKEKYIIEIASILKKFPENKPNSMCFYLIKYFIINKYRSLSGEVLLNHIIKIYQTNPNSLVANSSIKFKNIKGLKTSYKKLINKNTIFVFNDKENNYRLDEKEAFEYLKSHLGNYTINECSILPKTPNKCTKREKTLSLDESQSRSYSPDIRKIRSNKNNNNIKKEKSRDFEENIRIKRETFNVEEEKQSSKENKIKKETRIKEEEKIKEEIINDEELDLHKIIELFNGKLYEDFYYSLGEAVSFQELQEKIEKFQEINNQNNYKGNNDLSPIINKITQIKELLDKIKIDKESYDKLTTEFETIKDKVLFFIELLSIKFAEIEISKDIQSNESKDFPKIFKETINIYKFEKEGHDKAYQELVSAIKTINNILSSAGKNKDAIRKEFFEFIDYLKENSIFFENIKDFYDIADNFKKEYKNYSLNSSISQAISTEETFQKYSEYMKVFEEKISKSLNE